MLQIVSSMEVINDIFSRHLHVLTVKQKSSVEHGISYQVAVEGRMDFFAVLEKLKTVRKELIVTKYGGHFLSPVVGWMQTFNYF